MIHITFRAWSLLLSFLTFYATTTTLSQTCTAPTSIGTPAITAASCPGSGRIVVTTVNPASPGSGNVYQYALMRKSDSSIAKPWQNNNTFSEVEAGNYYILVQKICSLGISNAVSREVTVNNTYTPALISSVATNRSAQCNNGRITVTATGTTPRTYALVQTLTEPNPGTGYVRELQSSAIFDSLPAGTYYVRAYDACGGYHTTPVTVGALDTNILNAPNLYRYACDSFRLQVNLKNLNATGAKVWVEWPNNTVDTLVYTGTSATTATISFPFSYANMSTGYTAAKFPDNIPAAAWPMTFKVYEQNACGQISNVNLTINKPGALTLGVSSNVSSIQNTCDALIHTFSVYHSSGAYNSATYSLISDKVTYSLDSGRTWHAALSASPGYASSSNGFLIRRGTTLRLLVAYCDDTLSRVITVAANPVFAVTLTEFNLGACLERSGIRLSVSGSPADSLSIEMISAPAGQSLLPKFNYPNTNASGTNIEYPVQLSNLLPGAYTFRFTDSIGNACYTSINRTITLNYPLALDFTTQYNCSKALVVNTTNTYRSGASNLALGSYLKVQIIDSAGNILAGGTAGLSGTASGTATNVTIPAGTLNAIPNGNYFIVTFVNFANRNTACTRVVKPFAKEEIFINLSHSRMLTGCSGDTTIASVVGGAAGGTPPFIWTLFRNAIYTDSIVSGPQTSNIFSGLSSNVVYYLQVADQCGRGNNIRISNNKANVLRFNINRATMPCVGDTISFTMDNMSGVAYEWYKNDTLMAGVHTNEITLRNIEKARDSGTYKAKLIVGACQVVTTSFLLNPDLCGMPLPVGLGYFAVYNKPDKVALVWETYSEQNSEGFLIQRSQNAMEWETIGWVPTKAVTGEGKGNLDYAFDDTAPLSGQSYYRLVLQDRNTYLQYSEIKWVHRISSGNEPLYIYPNPVQGDGLLYVRANEPVIVLQLKDVTGKCIMRKEVPETQQQWALPHILPGLYYLHYLLKNGSTGIEKIIVR